MLDLIMHQGEIEARGAQQNAAIWGGALQGIGQTLAGGIEQRGIRKRDEAWLSYVESGEWQQDPAKAYAAAVKTWGPEKGPAQFQALQGVMTLRGPKRDPVADSKSLGTIIGAMDELDESGRARLYPQAYSLAARVYPDLKYDAEYNPERWPELRSLGAQLRGDKAPGSREIKTRNADGSETVRIVADTPGQEFTSAAEPPKPETRSIDVQAAEALARGDRATYDRLLRVKKEMGQADDRPRDNSPRPISPTAEAQIINRLTTQWDRVATPVRELDRQVGIMDAGLNAARRGDVNAGSQAVIMTFNKILDSLSVVREAEFLRTAAGQSMVNRIKGAIEKLSVGGAGVPLPELEKFADLAREMASEQKKFLPSMQNRIGLTADRYGVPRELIFEAAPTTGTPPPAGAGSAAGGTPGPPTVGTVMNGYRFKGGNPALPASWEKE
jgi:hypothetical protein